MAESNSTEYRGGAVACLGVLREVEQQLSDNTTGRHFEKQDAAIAAILALVGDLPPRAAGVVATLTEIFVGQIQVGGDYDLDIFRPESTMTPTEKAAVRREFTEACGSS